MRSADCHGKKSQSGAKGCKREMRENDSCLLMFAHCDEPWNDVKGSRDIPQIVGGARFGYLLGGVE